MIWENEKDASAGNAKTRVTNSSCQRILQSKATRMFRQAKRRITSRRNFAGQVGDSSGKFILDGTTTEEESKLYESLYESKLSFYQMPPKGEITLEQFEVWAINRLKVLLEIESCIQRNKSPKEMEIIVKPLLNKLLPSTSDDLQDRKKDYYSHFILRLCFCRSKELRDKFIRSETALLKLRFNMLTSRDQAKFCLLYTSRCV